MTDICGKKTLQPVSRSSGGFWLVWMHCEQAPGHEGDCILVERPRELPLTAARAGAVPPAEGGV